MSEVVPDVQHEFWRPPAARLQPVVLTASTPSLAETCAGCNTEFVAGSRFCYLCGAARNAVTEISAAQPSPSFQRAGFLRALSFQNVKQWLGLPLPSMITFLIGLGCLLAAMLVGMVYTVETTLDFQAVQLWRMEWLVGAAVAFIAGILLKSNRPAEK
jgi:hypothetical protein